MTSKYWKYYMKMPSAQAQCNICTKVIKTGGSTTNLRNHLKCKHKEYLDILEYVVVDQNNRFNNSKLHDIPITEENDNVTIEETLDETSRTVPSVTRSTSPAQSNSTNTSEDSVESNDPTNWEKGCLHYRKITHAILYMICIDNEPHTMVEMPGFVHFCQSLQPLYQLPSSNEMLEIIASQCKMMKSRIVTNLKEVKHMSLSCRILTAEKRNFLIIAAHFICPVKEEPKKLFLGIQCLEQNSTEEDVSNTIQRILNDFELDSTKITSVCSNESIILEAAIKQLFGEEKSVLCLADVFHTILNDGLNDESNPTLRSIIKEVEIAARYIQQNYTHLSEQLTKEEAEDVLQFVDYVDDVLPTTRNSVYHMLHNYLQLLPCLARALECGHFNDIPSILSNPSTNILTEITQILFLFEEATNELSANEHLTGSVIGPLISCVKSYLLDIPLVYNVSKGLCKKLLQSLETYTQAYLTNPLLCQASFCDPRFKKTYILPTSTNSVVEKCCTEVKQKLEKCSNDFDESVNVTVLWKVHDENMAKQKKTNSEIPYEFQVYLEQILLPRTADPLQFWLQNRGFMPSLSHIALKNLTVCSSTIPTDTLIKVLKKIFSDDSFCQQEEHIVERLFLNQLDEGYWEETNKN